ncbi:hypothetical protein J7T88_03985 [Streptococcus thermophilus]|uniref:hypothetical protein n=1 Tax=Streptococcus thermophilus TaxID=1308 RepID=UPI0035562E3E
MLTKQNIYIEEQKTKEIERLENIIAQLHEQINRKDEQIEREQEQAKNQAQAILTLTLKNETLRLETESNKKSWWKFWNKKTVQHADPFFLFQIIEQITLFNHFIIKHFTNIFHSLN